MPTERFAGKIFRVLFPFTDTGTSKQRPALALGEPDQFGDIPWAFITTKAHSQLEQIPILPEDLAEGSLPRTSFLVPGKIFTFNKDRIVHYYASTSPQFQSRLAKRFALHHTRSFSLLTHTANRPGDDPLRLAVEAGRPAPEKEPGTKNPQPSFKKSPVPVPYAGRVFTEDEVEAAVSATLDFWLTLGSEGTAFEKELAAFLGVKHSLLVNSGSSANLIALSCLTSHKLPEHKRLRPGDEVITCAAGFPTTVAPIVQNGCVPVFIDNDPVTGNARVDQLEAAYSPGKTKAVMMAHTLGNPFDLGAVLAFCKKYDLWLIEDNCDALGCTYTMPEELARELGLDHLLKTAENGAHPIIRLDASAAGGTRFLTAPTGSWGDLSTQSFYPPHHLTMGEGGAVNIIRRPQLKTLAESFRDWGRDCWCPSGKDNTCGKRFGWQLGELPEGYDHKYIYSHLGYNLKPLDVQAAIGRVQLRRLPAFIEARKRNWEYLRRALDDLSDVFDFSLPTHATAWHPGDNSAPPGPERPPASDEQGTKNEHQRTKNEEPKTTYPTSSSFSWDATACRTDCSWFGFMLRVRPQAPFTVREFAAHLDEYKIGNRMLFGGNLVRQPVFVQLRKDNPAAFRVAGGGDKTGALPGADEIMHSAIFLGTYPGLTQAQLDYEIAVIRSFVGQKTSAAPGRTPAP